MEKCDICLVEKARCIKYSIYANNIKKQYYVFAYGYTYVSISIKKWPGSLCLELITLIEWGWR